jgi:hypothetical protein
MNTQEYVAMKSDEQLDYMDTAAADELFALVDALFAEASTMSKQGKKLVLSGDDSGTALIKKANKYSAFAENLRNRTMVREGKW